MLAAAIAPVVANKPDPSACRCARAHWTVRYPVRVAECERIHREHPDGIAYSSALFLRWQALMFGGCEPHPNALDRPHHCGLGDVVSDRQIGASSSAIALSTAGLARPIAVMFLMTMQCWWHG